MPTDHKLRVFLCHASQDKPIVRELYQRLLAEGWIDPWLDEEKLKPGEDWKIEIPKAVKKSDVILVFVSRKALNNLKRGGVLKDELKVALSVAMERPRGAITIIPIRLQPVPSPDELKPYQWVDYFVDIDKEKPYQRVLESLEAVKPKSIAKFRLSLPLQIAVALIGLFATVIAALLPLMFPDGIFPSITATISPTVTIEPYSFVTSTQSLTQTPILSPTSPFTETPSITPLPPFVFIEDFSNDINSWAGSSTTYKAFVDSGSLQINFINYTRRTFFFTCPPTICEIPLERSNYLIRLIIRPSSDDSIYTGIVFGSADPFGENPILGYGISMNNQGGVRFVYFTKNETYLDVNSDKFKPIANSQVLDVEIKDGVATISVNGIVIPSTDGKPIKLSYPVGGYFGIYVGAPKPYSSVYYDLIRIESLP